MFHQGALGTWFTELYLVQGTTPSCGECGRVLPRKGHAHKDGQGKPTFWSIKCPDGVCRTSHIIFNNTPEMAHYLATGERPDPAQAAASVTWQGDDLFDGQ